MFLMHSVSAAESSLMSVLDWLPALRPHEATLSWGARPTGPAAGNKQPAPVKNRSRFVAFPNADKQAELPGQKQRHATRYEQQQHMACSWAGQTLANQATGSHSIATTDLGSQLLLQPLLTWSPCALATISSQRNRSDRTKTESKDFRSFPRPAAHWSVVSATPARVCDNASVKLARQLASRSRSFEPGHLDSCTGQRCRLWSGNSLPSAMCLFTSCRSNKS
jgi:hypothetical protein